MSRKSHQQCHCDRKDKEECTHIRGYYNPNADILSESIFVIICNDNQTSHNQHKNFNEVVSDISLQRAIQVLKPIDLKARVKTKQK